jgi:hypothetical protein
MKFIKQEKSQKKEANASFFVFVYLLVMHQSKTPKVNRLPQDLLLRSGSELIDL